MRLNLIGRMAIWRSKTFTIVLSIDTTLSDFFVEVERYFSINIDDAVRQRIFKDCQEDQVNDKAYAIFSGKSTLSKLPLMIEGNVDEYEPYEIWITIRNISNRDVRHFEHFMKDSASFS